MRWTFSSSAVAIADGWGCGLAIALSCLLAGCGESGPKGDQAQVTGSVTFAGKPITLDSSIVFYCKDHAATASGKIDSLGGYNLTAAIPSIGIPVGRYQVMVRPPEAPAAQVGSDQYKEQMMGKVKKPEVAKDIPLIFQSLNSSKIVLELKPGPNKFDFDLEKLSK